MMLYEKILNDSSAFLHTIKGHRFDLIKLSKPKNASELIYISKIVSKLSPMIGNLIEFKAVEYLNENNKFSENGNWLRQDPGFPDAIFLGSVTPTPGIEIKTWFPLATEITARFKDSQKHFLDNQTNVALLAWIPENLLWGSPKIIGVCILSAQSVAKYRDTHYHKPPDYLVLEPGDTKSRTVNLQQSNTNGYKWQGSEDEFLEAQKIVSSWDELLTHSVEGQGQLRELVKIFRYRLDTNFAKIDRIQHPEIEKFKVDMLNYMYKGKSLKEWIKILNEKDEKKLLKNLKEAFNL